MIDRYIHVLVCTEIQYMYVGKMIGVVGSRWVSLVNKCNAKVHSLPFLHTGGQFSCPPDQLYHKEYDKIHFSPRW